MKSDLSSLARAVSLQAAKIATLGEKSGKEEYFIRYAKRWANPVMVASVGRLMLKFAETTRISFKNSQVIDYGCKYGETSLLLSELGASKVTGVDIVPEYVQGGQYWTRELGLGTRIEFFLLPGDEHHLTSNTADIVLMIEVISHINTEELDRVLQGIHKILKPGGWLLVSDGNNWDNVRVRYKLRKLWNYFENGPAGIHYDGHTVREPLCQRRYAIIKELATDQPEEVLRELAVRTCYLWGDSLKQAVLHYLDSRELPNSRFQPHRCPVYPENGAMVEKPYGAFELATRLEALGFRARPLFITDREGLLGRSMDAIGLTIPSLARFIWNGFRLAAQKLPRTAS